MNSALSGEDQVVWIATHSFNNICKFVDQSLTQLLKSADSMGVDVQFATAREAGASVAGLACEPGIELNIGMTNDTLMILATHPIFQSTPYCAVKFKSGTYERVRPKTLGKLTWFALVPEGKLETFVCGACDAIGLPVVARYDFK